MAEHEWSDVECAVRVVAATEDSLRCDLRQGRGLDGSRCRGVRYTCGVFDESAVTKALWVTYFWVCCWSR